MATAERAEALGAEQRDFLFWLQGRSVATRGVGALAEEFLAQHAGSVRIRLYGCQLGRPREFSNAEMVPHVANYFLFLCKATTGDTCFSDAYTVRIEGSSLSKFREHHEAQARLRFVETSVGSVVHDCLNNALRLGRLVAIEGPPGFGKSFAAQAWSDLHLDKTRYVRLRGISNRSGFFFTVLERLGFTGIEHSGADKLQRMLQNFLRTSRLMLLIDEAQNLLPAKECSKKRPELLDWIAGETFDESIPCALLTWADFATRRAAAEQSTSWRAEHLSRRISRYTRLQTPPTKADFLAVAKAMLPDAGKGCHDLIAAYATLSKHYMQAVVDVIAEARDLAEISGRKEVIFADVDAAVSQRAISDAAQVEALSTVPRARGRNSPPPVLPVPPAPATPSTMQPPGRSTAAPTLPASRAVTPAKEVTC